MRVIPVENLLKIHYYGGIIQQSGEDWPEAMLSLSTATPSVGGNLPTLGTTKISFDRPTPYKYKKYLTNTDDKVRLTLTVAYVLLSQSFELKHSGFDDYDRTLSQCALSTQRLF